MYRVIAATTIGLVTVGVTGFTSPSAESSLKFFSTKVSSFLSFLNFRDGEYVENVHPGFLSIVAQAKALVPDTQVQSQEDPLLKRRNEIMKFGYPTMDNIKQLKDHVLAYSHFHKGPLWVCEHLTDENINFNKNISRSQSKFVPDGTVHPFFRGYNGDYLNSGYDRGHLAAAANHRHSQRAMDDTFYLSNICPQIGKGLNRSKWNDLEKRSRSLARKHGSAHVLTGPLYLPTVEGDEKFIKYKLIGDNNVAVPTHFFKVIVSTNKDGGYILESYVMPNEEIRKDIPITSYMVPKSSIERGAGFLIFNYIADSQYSKVNGIENKSFIR